jgi:hypothetical protein
MPWWKCFAHPGKSQSPEVRAAHRAVQEALISGKLVRPTHCTRCGERPGGWLLPWDEELGLATTNQRP